MASLALSYETLSDVELARRIAQRDPLAARVVIKRNNQRLFRAAWSVLKDRSEAEEAVQDGYLKAFAAIASFAGKSSLSTWLTRVVLNEALARRRSTQRRLRHLRQQSVTIIDEYREKLMRGSDRGLSPEADVARVQIAKLLEAAIADLPEAFRLVLVLRDVDGLSVEETAEVLQRRRLQATLAPSLKDALKGAFPFAGAECDALTERVLATFVSGTH
jgi:RNA polymerase sigma-70 factor (ECF subfamily)